MSSLHEKCIKCGYERWQHDSTLEYPDMEKDVWIKNQWFTPKEENKVGIRKPSFNCLDCTVWIINANHTHPASESCKQCHHYKGMAAEGVYCAKENLKEDKVAEKQEYKVIKEFTKYDYIVAHQKKYGWTSFKDSCAEFQKDMERWTDSDEEIHSRIFQEPLYSDNFYKHGVMFGFLEKVDPEVFYKVFDKFQSSCGDYTFTILKVGNPTIVQLVSTDSCNVCLTEGRVMVSDINRITQAELKKLTGLALSLKKVSK